MTEMLLEEACLAVFTVLALQFQCQLCRLKFLCHVADGTKWFDKLYVAFALPGATIAVK